MNIDVINYTDDEIISMANKIYNDYGLTFNWKKAPVRAIKNLAYILDEYNINTDEKMDVLECAARIKYEIKKALETNYSLSLNRYYFRYKKNNFATKMAIANNYGFDKSFIYYLPSLIQSSLNNAYFKTNEDEQVKVRKLVS